MKIRQISACDTDGVKDFIESIMDGEFSKEKHAYAYDDLDKLEEHYGGDREIFLVAEKNGKIAGTVAIKEDGKDTALLRRIFVRKDCRGKGYGSRLLAKAMEFCFNHNYKTVTFRGTEQMRSAVQLCLQNGFEQDDISELGDLEILVLSKDLQ